jgi:hypothetical protein
VKQDISNFSVVMSLLALAGAGLIILLTLAAVFILNSQAVPQTPFILGPPQ